MIITTLEWLILNHPWPDGAPLWAHAACTLVPFAIAAAVYTRSGRGSQLEVDEPK